MSQAEHSAVKAAVDLYGFDGHPQRGTTLHP
jgi:hypothetical protein